ncbi:GNAT family N-acetyltransferase [Bacillus spongiae]|uniref:GNAT family N-acetyltransferase n=1 Tax=Bacillus spongiae TaxID=2683610 RepID=A0ABU8HGZ7_9BACI
MLKKRDLQECPSLYELLVHPDVFPFVREKAYSYDEFVFLTNKNLNAEENGQLISRTILDEWENPIGTISLFDINEGAGFLGTWLGKPYHGKGYNAMAKDAFFQELFFELNMETIFMRIRKENHRSRKAVEKLSYVVNANHSRPTLFNQLNPHAILYDLYEVPKDLYTLFHISGNEATQSIQALEA